ncbi:MAG: glycosyltransferase family 2 protein [Rhodanobacter sp.]|nr:MAG: glycosyltransferase family 2 protein [Rhodanobacter sp.]
MYRSVAVAIPALNEEQSLPGLLKGLISQKVPGVYQVSFTVLDDASEDRTAVVAQEVANTDNRVRLLRASQRKGKTAQLRSFLETTDAEIVVFVDADVILGGESVLSDLLESIRDGASLASGCPVPVARSTFWGRGSTFSGKALRAVRSKVNGGNNLFACHGRILAMNRSMIDILLAEVWPPAPIGEDTFFYIAAQEHGERFVYVPSAIVWFGVAANPREFMLQNARFSRDLNALTGLFGRRNVHRYTALPLALVLREITALAFRDVIGAVSWLLLKIVCFVGTGQVEDAAWGVSQSTKGIKPRGLQQ